MSGSVTLTACGAGCDASTFEQTCTADGTALTACFLGMSGEQDCVENFGDNNVCCVIDGDATCAYPQGVACTFDSDCCSGTCGTDGNCT